MATFVMIHGAWHGGWSFDSLRAPIEAAGHAMVAPDLPGMGGDEAALAAVTLDLWAEFALVQCRVQERPVILCGHSRGGLVLSRAAELDPSAMDALVYICAILIPDGVSRAEFQRDQARNPDFAAIIRATPGGAGSVVDPKRAGAIFAQLSPPDAVARNLARLVVEPRAPRETRMEVTEARFGSVPRHYVECSHDRTIPLADQRRMQAALPCASVTTLEADHSPFLSAPEALAEALLKLA